MKTWLQRINLETMLYILALLLGMLLRFAQLGHAALNESEARLALQALDIFRGQDLFSSPEPGTILITGLLMFVFGASNFTARLWPAAAGSLMVIAAWMLREQLGRKPALILAFLIALDPLLIGMSRTAVGQSAAISSLLLGFILLLRGSSGWAGFFVGLSLLGGPAVWPGAISAAVVFWLFRGRNSEFNLEAAAMDWRKFALVAVGVFGLLGSLFFLVPSGLGAAASSLTGYLAGWTVSTGVPFPRLLGGILAYQLPAVIFGLAGLVRGLRAKSPIDQALGAWWGISLLLALAYPSRTVLDVGWAAFPMLVLAARQLASLAIPENEDRLPVLGHAALTAVLAIFTVYTLLFTSFGAGQVLPMEPLIRIGMALVLLFAISGMVAWGWSLRVAATGLQWGAITLLTILSISAVFHAVGVSRKPEAELFNPSPYVVSADILGLSLDEAAKWRPDPTTPLSIAVIDYNSSALQWMLRDYPQTIFTSVASSDSQPDVVISPKTSTPDLAAEYRGQAVTWTLTPAWSLLAPGEWLRWLMYRDVPVEGLESQQFVYWVKSDDFPGGVTQDVPAAAPAEQSPEGQDPGAQ